MENHLQKMKSAISGISNWIIRIVGSLILIVLVWYALTRTQYMLPVSGLEFPIEIKDSVGLNLISIVVIVTLYIVLNNVEEHVSGNVITWCQRVAVGLAMLWQGIAGMCWVLSANRMLYADQANVYNSAGGFFRGDYGALDAQQYCGIFPHQLGLAALEEGLFHILGYQDYHVIQVLFVLLNVGSVYCVYGILKELSGRLSTVVVGTTLMGSCICSVFYSSWVYGEVPWVFNSLLTGWMLARYIKRGRKTSLAVGVIAMTIGMLVRKNMLILIIAFSLAGTIYAFVHKDKRVIVAVVLSLVIPQLCYQGIFTMYEMRSGYKHSEGLPVNAYIYIGMEETKGRCGWDFYNSSAQYYANNGDTEKARQVYGEMIKERWQSMRDGKGYLQGFYKAKILSQWNAPLYQALYFNFGHEEVYNSKLTSFLDRFNDDWFEGVVWLADRLQFLVYVGCLLYFVLCVKKDSNILGHVLAVTIIGGFLFSIIWEAKARYMYAYYMMMFPLAALGYGELVRLAEKYCFFRKKKI